MDNSRSLEALYQDGTGMVSLPKKSYKASIEGYDGFDDILSAEMAKSEENLTFLDTFQMIEAKNAADKVKMLKKISTVYGSRSGMPATAAASIESLCRIQSLETAETAEAAGVDTGNEKAKTPESTQKKAGFLKTVFKNIGKFFKFIADMFKRIGARIAGIFKKDETGAPTTAPSSTVDMNLGNSSTDENANASSAKSSAGGFKMPEILVDLRTLNIAGMQEFSNKYHQVADAASKLKNISLEAGTKAAAQFDKNLKDVTPRAADLIRAAGFSASVNTAKLAATVNSKDHFKQLEKQLGAAKDKDAIEKMMSHLFGVSIMKKAEDWNKAASSKDFTAKCGNFSNAMQKVTSVFADSADIFNEVADTLGDKVDSLVSQRQTTVKGTDGNDHATWTNNAKQQGENKMNDIESSLAICASMLKFNAKIGKTIIDITTKIQSTMVAAKNHRKAINAGAQAAMQSARNAAK